jgi:probable O-glycosylation ligase (exosortase A-associated)
MKGLIFTYVLTYGGAVVSLIDPYPGLLIYICFAVIRPESMWYWSVPGGNYSRVVAMALLAGWTLRGFGRWRFGQAAGVVAALLGYWLWAALSSALVAADQAVAWKYVEDLTKIVLPFLVGITTIDSPRRLKLLAWVIALSHGYVAFEMNLAYYVDGFNRVHQIGFGGMDNNGLAIAMVASTGLSFFLGLHAENLWLRAVALLSGLLTAHTVLLAYSRGGMLALILTGLASFWLLPKRPVHIVMFLIAVAVGIRLAGPEVQQRFSSSFAAEENRDSSAESRLQLWSDCCDVILKHPVLGIGPDHWHLIAHTYGWPAGKEAHTTWLQACAEVGVPGLLLLFLFYGLSVVRLRPLARESTPVADPCYRYLARAVIASVCGFALAAQFVTLPGLEAPYYIVLVGALTLKLNSLAAESGELTPPDPETAAQHEPLYTPADV